MERSLGLAILFISAIISASSVSEDTCAGLEHLTRRVNPKLLSNCAVDEACSQGSCETSGLLASYYSSITFSPEPCGERPGVKIDLVQAQEDGRAIPTQLVRRQTVISIGPLTIIVFVNATGTSVNIAIEHISIADGEVDFSDYLLNLTSIYIDRTGCTSNPGSGITMATTATMTSEESEEAISSKATVSVATATPTATGKSTTESLPKIGSNAKTCAGLAQLAMNANPLTLSKCVRDDSCSRLTCQTNGSLRSQLDTFVLTLGPCKTPPGVLLEFMKGGKSLVSQMITKPIQINGTIGSAMLEADVFVNTTGNTIGISVNALTVYDQSISEDPVSYGFLNFTVVPFETVYFCSSEASLTFKLWSMDIKSCNLILLSLTALFFSTIH